MNEDWSFPNDATPPGSAAYYVARFSPPTRRDAVAAWLAWFDLLDRAVRQASDPGVTRLKLDWWREEAQRLPAGDARHPIAQALLAEVQADWQVAQMQRALDATEARVMRAAPHDLGDCLAQAREEQAPRLQLLAGPVDTEQQSAIETAGGYVGTVARLQRLGEDVHRDALTLPADRLRAAGLDLDSLRRAPEVPALASLGEALLAAAEAAWRQAPLRREPATAPVHAVIAQHRRIARLLRRHRFQSHRRILRPTPLGLLWSAWRGR